MLLINPTSLTPCTLQHDHKFVALSIFSLRETQNSQEPASGHRFKAMATAAQGLHHTSTAAVDSKTTFKTVLARVQPAGTLHAAEAAKMVRYRSH
jgi:hypothetical protein